MSSRLKAAFGYSAVESVGSRVFDFATLWILLNTLPTFDLADFGVATSLLFVFNLIFVAPETVLLRDQKKWKESGELVDYLSSFYAFSLFKIIILYLIAGGVYCFYGLENWFLITVLLAIAAQHIQFAEISRIYQRMELQQKSVASFEIVSKFFLTLICLAQLLYPGIYIYLVIYVVWSALISWLWFARIYSHVELRFVNFSTVKNCILGALMGFSLWQHLSGSLTLYLYNIDPFFLKLVGTDVASLANYTVALKVSNLFFVIPMFFQSFVPVALANAERGKQQVFHKILKINALLAVCQFIGFVLLGYFVSPFFGVPDEKRMDFFIIGVLINVGVLFLNLARPLSTYLLITYSAKKMLFAVFIPTAFVGTIVYALGSFYGGVIGCAIASAFGYAYFGGSLVWVYRKTERLNNVNPVCESQL